MKQKNSKKQSKKTDLEQRRLEKISKEMPNTDKNSMLVWNYQNTNEENIRYIALETAPFSDLKNQGATDLDIEKMLWAIDRVVLGLVQTFNLVPKDPSFDNFVKEGMLKEVGTEHLDLLTNSDAVNTSADVKMTVESKVQNNSET